MSDAISQIQASYDAIEDRILLKIKTHNQRVYSAWITRRYLRLLIPALQGQHPQTGETLFPPQQTLANQTETAEDDLDLNDFDTLYEEPESPEYPLGEEPVLLTRIAFKEMDSDHPQLNLDPEEGPGIGLPFQPDVLGILLKIFGQALHSANWQLDLEPILQLPRESRLQ
ncbi:hypothetical protein [Thiomicrorhabdus chilensis]|uniref:hypothetical protein n=1 Tax=Thiomicrorhabdus chilensis TaxID=63656 RepID=UPI0004046A5E|nr:hypothetical protein [Thiomicrorhabdus chilensis]